MMEIVKALPQKPVNKELPSNDEESEEEEDEATNVLTLLKNPISPTTRSRKDFAVETLLGEGNFGKVWRVTEVTSGEIFAMKQVALDHCYDPLTDVFMEMDVWVTVNGHSGIVELQHCFFDEDIFYVMHICKGSLGQVDTNSAIDIRELVKQMADAFHYLQERGVVHLDIKPNNILIAHDDSFKICDFGISRFITCNQDYYEADFRYGTSPFAALESSSYLYTKSSDWYSFGCTLFWLHLNESGRKKAQSASWICLCDLIDYYDFDEIGLSMISTWKASLPLMKGLLSYNYFQRPQPNKWTALLYDHPSQLHDGCGCKIKVPDWKGEFETRTIRINPGVAKWLPYFSHAKKIKVRYEFKSKITNDC